jgi:hypothetical protein
MSILSAKSSFVSGNSAKSTLVGKDIVGYCGKCKMNLMHVVITVDALGKPDRARCNTCKTERVFRPKRLDDETIANAKGESKVANDMDEYDMEQMDVSGVFAEKTAPKKKPKAKKEKSESSSKASAKAQGDLPLSMQKGTAEDIAQFEARTLGQKNAVANARDYKASQFFAQGEAIKHVTFGTGFVVAEPGATKIEVLFKEGRKLLVRGLKGS